MTEHGDWWSPRGIHGAGASDSWHTSPLIDLSPHPRATGLRPGRVLAAVIAGAAALTVAIAGGGIVVDHHSGTLTSGLPGILPPAANTSATNQPTPQTPQSHKSAAPAPVLSVP